MPSAGSEVPDIAACTIASHNYLGMAGVLATSYAEHHPDAEVYVCLVDRKQPDVDYESLPYRCLFADELGIPNFPNFAFRYDVLELNTAVKPFVLAALRDRFGHDRAFYFDPDIWILDRVDALAARLHEHPMVLTPHVTAPLDDDHDPAERKILQVGVYNLGFLGLRLDDSTREFLDWWQDRLHRFCLADPPHGLFVDQQWASFAPAFVEGVFVERDPIYNVAYWNLPHRHPVDADGAWRVDGRKVGFFHFSGVQFDDLRTVSKHQDRLAPGSRPELRPLFEAYRDEVLAAGHEDWKKRLYTYDHFLDGSGESGDKVAPIPKVARQTLQRVDPYARRWSDPFDASNGGSFFAWLRQPLPVPAGTVNRAALALWESRDDLLLTFPDLQALDLHGYLDWIAEETEAGRPPLPEAFTESLRSRMPRRVARHLAASGAVSADPSGGSEARRVYRVHRGDDAVVRALRLRQAGNLTAWLNDPVPGRRAERPVVTRLMMLLFEMREDLRRDYPDPLGDDQATFAYWFCREGAAEFDVADDFVVPVRRSLRWRSRLSLLRQRLSSGSTAAEPVARKAEPAPAAEPELDPPQETLAADPDALRSGGVQIVGCFSGDASIEESSAALAGALESEERDVVRLALDQNVWGKSSGGRIHPPDGAPYDVTVLHVPPHRTAEALSTLPAAVRAGRVVAWWWWDLAHLHLGGVSTFDGLDEIWVPSRFVQRAVEPLADVPVRLVPPFVPTPDVSEDDRSILRSLHGEASSDEHLIVYSSFDAGDVLERANPFALLDLFRRLGREPRPAGKTPSLSLRIDRAGRDVDLVDELRRRAARSESGSGPLEVTIHDDPAVPESHLLASSDVWLGLDRGSAVGQRALRAMLLGKPVVATGYGGLADVLDAESGYPVDYRLERLERHEGPFPAGAVWAEPDLDHALEQVHAVLRNPGEAETRGAAGRSRAAWLYGRDQVAERLDAALANLRSVRRPE